MSKHRLHYRRISVIECLACLIRTSKYHDNHNFLLEYQISTQHPTISEFSWKSQYGVLTLSLLKTDIWFKSLQTVWKEGSQSRNIWYTLKCGQESAFFSVQCLVLECLLPFVDIFGASQSSSCSKSHYVGNSLQRVPVGSLGQWSALYPPPWPYWGSWTAWVLWEKLVEK